MYCCLLLIYTQCDWLKWMEDRETPRMHKYGERKMTQIMMATVPHVTAWAGRTKYHADGFLLDWVYPDIYTRNFQGEDNMWWNIH